MFRRILVAIDGSPSSELALQTALELAALRGSSIRIVTVLEHHPVSFGGYPYGESGLRFLEVARRWASDLLTAAHQAASKSQIAAETRLLDGAGLRLGETIADEARAWSADLIVVGSHGHSDIGHATLGSGAQEVLRLAPAPVLIVRKRGSA